FDSSPEEAEKHQNIYPALSSRSSPPPISASGCTSSLSTSNMNKTIGGEISP
ncbi:unnamed protein product, partial [Amoebophrya sp. A25]